MNRQQFEEIKKNVRLTFETEGHTQLPKKLCDGEGGYCFLGGILHGAGWKDENITYQKNGLTQNLRNRFGLDMRLRDFIYLKNDHQNVGWQEILNELEGKIQDE